MASYGAAKAKEAMADEKPDQKVSRAVTQIQYVDNVFVSLPEGARIFVEWASCPDRSSN